MSQAVPVTATIHVPPWLWGGNPARFFAQAGLHARPRSTNDETWTVKTEEHHTKVRPGLVEVHHLAGPRQRLQRFDRLDVFAGPPLRGATSAHEQDVLIKRTERALTTKELVDSFGVYTLQTILAGQAQLPEIAKHVYDELRDFRFAEDSSQVFPDAAVHVVRRRTELANRLKWQACSSGSSTIANWQVAT